MSKLNPQQQIAVDTIDGPLLINAGAGSGKTHTLTHRVVAMIQKSQISPQAILCVTFTNKAAHEMRERIAKSLEVNLESSHPFRQKGLPIIGTFHAVASFFLRNFADQIGYGKDFSIYDTDDCIRIVKNIMKVKNIDPKEFHPRAIYGAISQAKSDGISPNDYAKSVHSSLTSAVNDVYHGYAYTLRTNNAMDFDDLLLNFRAILDIPEVLSYFHQRFSYFLVDEYQDTNTMQYEIIRILASHTKNLCVVGDDWQGIYSWRGADIGNILSFQKDYPNAKIIQLEENYRSTKTIIHAANAVIKNNTNQMDKTLFTENPQGDAIILLENADDRNEADNIIQNFLDLQEKNSEIRYADCAILYRTNGQSRMLEEALIRKNIPYRVFGGMKFYERKEIKDILAYIRLIFNPYDTASMQRIINVPSRKIGEKSQENFLQILEREKMNLSDISENPWILESLRGIGAQGIQRFCAIYRELQQISRTESLAVLMQKVIEHTHYLEYLEKEYDKEEFEEKKENLDEFLSMASRYDGLIYPENIASFLEDIALITDQDKNTHNNDEEGSVSLMTVHLAKGLEFSCVCIAGVEEGMFPHSRSITDTAQLEEERRLMYVAMTRAKQHLLISRAFERFKFGEYGRNPASRFLKEIPEEFLYTKSPAKNTSIFGTLGRQSGFLHAAIDTSSRAPSAIKNNAADFAVGTRIHHPQYGQGVIIGIVEGIGEIAFAGMGIKKMNLAIAPIKKV